MTEQRRAGVCGHVLLMFFELHSERGADMGSVSPTFPCLHTGSCSGSSGPVEALFRGLTAATADRSAAFLFWPGFTCAAGFITEGFTFSLGLTGKGANQKQDIVKPCVVSGQLQCIRWPKCEIPQLFSAFSNLS